MGYDMTGRWVRDVGFRVLLARAARFRGRA